MTTWANLFLRGTVGTNPGAFAQSHLPAAAVLSVADLKMIASSAESNAPARRIGVNFKRVRIERDPASPAAPHLTLVLEQSELF